MGETMPRFRSACGAELAEGTTRCARCDTHGESGDFAVNRAGIRKVRGKRGATDAYTSSPDRVIIKTASQTYKLQVAGSLRAVKDAFRQAGLAS